MPMTATEVQKLYVAYFNRPADYLGLEYWKTQSPAAAASAFAASAEYAATYAGMDTGARVNAIYQNLFGHAADLPGLAYWSAQVSAGRLTIADVVVAVSNGAQGTDLAAFNAKVTAASAFTTALDTTAEVTGYSGTGANNAAKAWLAGINSAAQATAATVSAALDATVAGVVAVGGIQGTTYTLTTGLDTVSGTSANDTINATVSATAADNTLALADVINGGAGSDTLNVVASVLAADIAVPAGNIQSVETINIRALDSDGTVGTDAATFVASGASGVTAVNADRSTSNVTVTGLASGASVGMIGDGVVSNGILKYAYATATADQVINISGGTSKAGVADITATASTGVTKATINSTGAANSVDTIKLDSAGGGTVTTLNVNAASNLTATLTAGDFAATSALTVSGAAAKVDLGTAGNFKTIDASGLAAGGLTIALGTNATSFKGGQGNDVVTTAAVAATAAGAVDAGAGSADVLSVGAATDVDTASEAAVYAGFEVLKNSTNSDLDVSLFTGSSIGAIQLAGGAGATKMTAAQAAAITNVTNNDTLTLALTTATGSSDVLSVTLANTTATTSADLTTATVDGFETMNVVSSSGSSADISALSFASAANLTALNISGAKPISVSTANITKAATISATGLTYVGSTTTDYALTLSGNLVKGSSVVGSGAADSLTTSAAISGTSGDYVTYDAGAGNDALSSTVAAINNTSAANGSVKIEGGSGTDTLTLTDAAGLTFADNNAQFLTGIEKITYAVANQAISFTSGGFFDTNFKGTGVTLTLGDGTNAQANTVNLSTFTGAATVTLTASAATTQDQVVTTGSGADVVKVSAAATTTGDITVNTGAGNDTITVTVSAALAAGAVITVNGGAGQDSITFSGFAAADINYGIIDVNAGHSTLAAYDSITGFAVSDGTTEGMQLNFDGTADAAANVSAGAVTGYTSAELTYSVASGVLSFSGTSASGLSNAAKASLAQSLITASNATVAWSDGTDAWVFHNSSSGDSLVRLVGVATVAGVDDAAANTTTANYIIV